MAATLQPNFKDFNQRNRLQDRAVFVDRLDGFQSLCPSLIHWISSSSDEFKAHGRRVHANNFSFVSFPSHRHGALRASHRARGERFRGHRSECKTPACRAISQLVRLRAVLLGCAVLNSLGAPFVSCRHSRSASADKRPRLHTSGRN
jgi:hypothetical protein